MINTSWARPLHLLLFPEFGSSSPMETHPLRHRRPWLSMILGNHSFSIVIVDVVAKDQGLKIALGALHGALPDATPEEIEAYDDECAICRLVDFLAHLKGY
ncbi:hypothetical protein HYC85_001177 [Camellia sinensis]|uniref:Uncharacterized protein n=1 Tax=Camellia sinensis TaxID=4442 RepID=A0A7J7I756_CAMSI|nr:hypothetical protein HYC85_001177 [Camellia sinensis]